MDSIPSAQFRLGEVLSMTLGLGGLGFDGALTLVCQASDWPRRRPPGWRCDPGGPWPSGSESAAAGRSRWGSGSRPTSSRRPVPIRLRRRRPDTRPSFRSRRRSAAASKVGKTRRFRRRRGFGPLKRKSTFKHFSYELISHRGESLTKVSGG